MKPNPDPIVTDAQTILRHAGYQALQPSVRPSWWGIDRDPERRPGVPMMHEHPRPLPNTRYPPEAQQGRSSVPKHGRTNKPMTPVFSTAVPLRGLSGAIRRLAYRYPDHKPRHWLLKMLGDRVDSWSCRARQWAGLALPLCAAAILVRRLAR